MSSQDASWLAVPEEMALLLNLIQVKGVGGSRLRTLVARFGAPSAIMAAGTEQLTGAGGIDPGLAASIHQAANSSFGVDQLAQAQRHEARVLSYWQSAYPGLLKKIADPPAVLFVRGNLDALDGFAIAVVGTRMPSQYGKQATEKLVEALVARYVTIVSGFARGIDTVAHTRAVKSGGRTVAVLGCGLDIVYPAENRKLVARVIDKGAIISEFPFGTKPDAMNFPRRNRIIAGLSAGTLIMEAREKSGALITAYQALEQNREVFAVPGSIFSRQSAGPHKLLKEGAKLVSRVEDILEEFPGQHEPETPAERSRPNDASLSETEQQALRHLGWTPTHIDDLARLSGMPPAQLLTVLLQLEFSGWVKQLPGKNFVRT